MSSTIRVGFQGLSASTHWANIAHFPYLKDSQKYTITALQNSSKQAAEASVTANSLPSTTAAYGSSEELAKDPNVDVVVTSVNVAKHYELAKPIIEAGKDIIVEWPLGANIKQAEELAELAKKKGVKNGVVLQGRFSPVILKVKEVVESGKLGKLLSTSVVGSSGWLNDDASLSEGLKYTLDIDVGGNLVTIFFIHLYDSISFALGELKSFSTLLKNQYETIKIVDKPGGKHLYDIPKSSHDKILLQGVLDNGAVTSFFLRGERAKDGVALRWEVHFEHGEIHITSAGTTPNTCPETTVKIYDSRTENWEEIKYEKESPAGNVGRFYEAWAKGEKFTTFEDAVQRHRLIEALYQGKST